MESVLERGRGHQLAGSIWLNFVAAGVQQRQVVGQEVNYLSAGERHPAERTLRPFRPDVQGLRAIAVMLVVLYHAQAPHITGGYVGVDAFFVLSGFLITDLLIREREKTGAISLLQFYARRARRILPAATLVLICTVLAAYEWLGFMRGGTIATDSLWSAGFMANLHFASVQTNYLNAGVLPSPLQHYWSLGVEEQFYLVWPALFVMVAASFGSIGLRTRLAIALGVVTVVSLAWSISGTYSNGTWAYFSFSPLTRAWELSTGGFFAVIAPALLRPPRWIGILLGLAGVFILIASATLFNAATPFPGYLALMPVSGTAAALVGGTIAGGTGIEIMLATGPFQFIGNRSYSLYLWHWPILAIAAQSAGGQLSPAHNLLLVLLAFALSCITYHLLENPIRHARFLMKRPAVSLALGLVLVAAVASVSLAELYAHRAPAAPVGYHALPASAGHSGAPESVS